MVNPEQFSIIKSMADEAQEFRVNDLFDGGVDSVAFQTAVTAIDPLKSLAKLVAHKATGDRYRQQEMAQHFNGADREREQSSGDLFTDLSRIEDVMFGVCGVSEELLGDRHDWWQGYKKQIESAHENSLKLGYHLEDVVILDSTKKEHYVFLSRKGLLVPVKLNQKGGEVLENAVVEFDRDLKDDLDLEMAALTIQKKLDLDPIDHRLVNLSKRHANVMPLKWHSIFDRDGVMSWDLRKRGAYTLGELLEVSRFFENYGICYSPEEGLQMDQDMYQTLTQVRSLSNPNLTSDEIAAEINNFALETVMYQSLLTYYIERPHLTEAFINSPQYHEAKKAFLDFHINGNGQTETRLAANMLANTYLLKFEQKTINESSSQELHPKTNDYLRETYKFLRENPQASLKDIFTTKDRGQIIDNLWQKLLHNPFDGVSVDPKKRQEVFTKANKAMGTATKEFKRHRIARAALEKVQKKSNYIFIDHEGKWQKPFRILIGNLGLAKVKEEGRFTMSSYMKADSYYDQYSQVLPLDRNESVTHDPEQPTDHQSVKDAIRYIFNGQNLLPEGDDAQSRYESQVSRMYTEGQVIIDYLSQSSEVPENVRKFIKTLTNGDLADRILERYGPSWDQDPEVVNPFVAKEGFSKFQVMTQYRYLHDFVRAIETELILKKPNPLEGVHRVTAGEWRNYDFSQVPDDVLDKAITEVLKNGEHRIKKLNHEAKINPLILKDVQEMMEKAFGWDTYDMKYLRWDKFMDVYHTLGGAWDCICFTRKPIFNVKTFQQW